MVEPRLPWPKPLIEIKRYLINEEYTEQVDRIWFIQKWIFVYSDGDLEILTKKTRID